MARNDVPYYRWPKLARRAFKCPVSESPEYSLSACRAVMREGGWCTDRLTPTMRFEKSAVAAETVINNANIL